MEQRNRRELNIPVILRFGPYWAWGTMKHRTQRLYGLTTKLEELGYNVLLEAADILEKLEVIINEVIVFTCRLTFLKYNCEYNNDIVCRRAVAAVERMFPKILTAALDVQEIEPSLEEISPAVEVLNNIIDSLPLPDTPVEGAIRSLLTSLPLIDTVPEGVLHSLLKNLWLADSVPESVALELVYRIPTHAPNEALHSLMEAVMESAARYPPHAMINELLQQLPLPSNCKCREKKQLRHTVVHEITTKAPIKLVCKCKELSGTEMN